MTPAKLRLEGVTCASVATITALPTAAAAIDLHSEAAGVRNLVWLTVAAALLIAAGLWVSHVVLRMAIQQVHLAGLDRRRRLLTLPFLAAIAAVAGVAATAIEVLLERSPVIGVVVIAAGMGGLAIAAASRTYGMIAGASLILRGDLRVGDRIAVGGSRGVVSDLGLLRIQVRSDDGAAVEVPIAVLLQQPVSILRESMPSRVTVRRTLAQPATPEKLQEMRLAASLCPYRRPGTPVQTVVVPDQPAIVETQLHAWSTAAADNAERWLQRVL